MASQDDRELSRSEDMPAEDVSVEGAVFWYLLLIVVAVSLFWRVTVLEPNPSTYHLPRYYAGMVHARMVWLHLHADERTESETEWLNANLRPFGEPPLLETLTSFVCMPLGSIQPRVACVITCLAWLAGGWFVFRTAELITKHRFAALAALAFYLLCPLAIVMSQMFQPEGLMTLALVVAIWMLVRFPPDQRWRRTLFLAVVCAVAGFVKPGILFLPIMGAYLGMRLGKDSLLKILFDGRSLLFAVVTLIPSVVWVLVFLQDRVGGKLMPAMLLDPMFYVHWFQKIDETLGWWVLVVLVVGAYAMFRRFHLALGWGLLGGYLIYAAAFPWHTATHNYYQVPLIPVVALCLATTVAFAWERIRFQQLGRRAAVVGFLLSLAAIFWYPTQSKRIVDLDQRVDIVELLGLDRIQQHVAPNTSVLCLDSISCYPLLYHCWLHAYTWPRFGDLNKELRQTGAVVSTEERFAKMVAEHDPRFFVITSGIHVQLLNALWDAESELRHAEILDTQSPRLNVELLILIFLEERFPLLVRDEKFVIYDLRADAEAKETGF